MQKVCTACSPRGRDAVIRPCSTFLRSLENVCPFAAETFLHQSPADGIYFHIAGYNCVRTQREENTPQPH